jgi:ATP-binding cassette, subfamily C, bacterial CydC
MSDDVMTDAVASGQADTASGVSESGPEESRGWGAVGHLVRSLRPVAVLLRPYRWWMLAAIVVHVLIYAATLAAAVVGALMVGKAISGAASAALVPLVWLIAAIVVPLGLFGFLDMYVTHAMSFRILHDLRLVLYRRFHDLAPAYLLQRRSGDVARASVADVELLEIFTSHVAPPAVAAFTIPVLALAALGLINPVLALVVLPFVVLVASVPTWLLDRARRQGQQLREDLGELGASVVDTVQGTREILAAGAQQLTISRVRRRHRTILAASVAHGRRAGIEQAATDALVGLAVVASFVAAVLLEVHGGITRAELPVVIILSTGAFAPLITLSATVQEIGQVAAAADRIHALLRAVPTVTDRTAARSPVLASSRVTFDAVTFRYRPGLAPALRDVSFDVEPGSTVALVGHSGAGKTTCINLLLRLWDTGQGAIRVGGHDVRDLPQDNLREHIAVVPQDIHLFHASVRDNIRIARPGATDDEVDRAARDAGVASFIAALPDGWDTLVGERGTSLSGGQRQRVAIARALLRAAPILVLDEAVSNLDAEAERDLHGSLSRVAERTTTIIIAHRPSTMRLADRLIVLEQGQVAETGTYDHLAHHDGPFGRLIRQSPLDS